MTKTLRTMTTTLGLAVIAAAIAPIAALGCDATPGTPAASPRPQAPYLMQAAYRPAQLVRVSDSAAASAPIVGLWKVTFVAENSPPTPDGTVVDWGFSEWHSDGTEIMNSAMHAPATQNFCLGVWETTGQSAYKLYHVALSYDATTGMLAEYVTVREQVTVAATGNQFNGKFTINVFDTDGNKLAEVAGVVTGQRITANQ